MSTAAPHPLLVALNRFGLGGRGDAALYLGNGAVDPRVFVKAELDKSAGALLDAPELGRTPTLLKAMFDFQEERRLQNLAATQAQNSQPPDQATPTGGAMAAPVSPPPKPPPQPPNVIQTTFRAEALARIRAATQAPLGLQERLVAFWSNHFAVSAAKSEFVRITAGSFEREAIRPYVLGRFADMLRAVEQHPTMIHYLDNQQSIGPESRAGKNNKKGLNENFAREIMELHTLGVNGGYSQTDVTTFAKILTGWTYAGREGRIGEPGTFGFVPQWHEPGPQTLLGKTYPEGDREQGEAALADLARNPATATHIAGKLARHFVADDPPPSLVARLADVFTKSDGDLKAVTVALVNSTEAWTAPLEKMRSPWEFMMASLRLFGRAPEDPNPTLGALNQLGEPLWTPPEPNGFADTVAAWASPEGMKLRLDLAARIAQQLRDPPNPKDQLDEAFGDAASPTTRDIVARAETKQQGVALLLMSPEMQRR